MFFFEFGHGLFEEIVGALVLAENEAVGEENFFEEFAGGDVWSRYVFAEAGAVVVEQSSRGVSR